MPTLFEYYNTGYDSYEYVYYWAEAQLAQTFTPTISHTIISVKLLLWQLDGVGTGNLTASIKATDGEGKPTGGALCSGSIDIATIPVSTTPPYMDDAEWMEITLGDGAVLTENTVYAIVLSSDNDAVYWNKDRTSPAYTGGYGWYSLDNGITWSNIFDAPPYDYCDFMFEEWGISGFTFVQTAIIG